jgi:hypothetical protein
MKRNIIVALIVGAGVLSSCGTSLPAAPVSGVVQTQVIDASGDPGADAGAGGGIQLSSPYTLLGTFTRGAGRYQTTNLNWRAEGFSYGWYDSPGVELRVCSQDASGAVLSCLTQSSSQPGAISLSCILADNAASIAVYAADITLHQPTSAVYATSVQSQTYVLAGPGPLPSLPHC